MHGRIRVPNLGVFYSSMRRVVRASFLRKRLKWAVPSRWMIRTLPRHPSGMVGRLLDRLPSEIQGASVGSIENSRAKTMLTQTVNEARPGYPDVAGFPG